MLIDSHLLVNSFDVIKGLVSGEMVRYGSVIRWAKGTENAGQIVKHLAEVPGIASRLITLPFSPITGGIDIIGHGLTYHKLLGIDQTLTGIGQNLVSMNSTLSSVMGLTQIAAGASILNLGVSIAGFAYMGYKLNQLQNSLNCIQKNMELGFDRVTTHLDLINRNTCNGFQLTFEGLKHLDQRLDAVSGQLAYLYLLLQESRTQQTNLSRSVSNIHKAMLIKEIADLQAKLKYFSPSTAQEVLITASRVRLFLSSQALQSTPELDAELMLNTDLAIQGWAAATATEANLLLDQGQHREARQLLAEEVPKFQAVAKIWCNALLEDENPTLKTADRFSAPPFEHYILPERVDRITQLSEPDQNRSDRQRRHQQNELAVEFEMSYAGDRYDHNWISRQIAISEYLDTLSELTARLDTLQDFAALCEATGASTRQDLLPTEQDQPGLYLLAGTPKT
ncbi:hypothetical protein [Prochlorothrix hollandica]|uniref:Uncharacterized protein n=1 Tax=Prochlorothrix hollandica PCC 9006 = CALU 1027 TaxID=317619 RepID=A0A0M2PWZ3_PROHO|nr:hypothetical protein [Prochlorothrix hollandica]KKJ00695.1 hypothetical protein PROH_05260 [Prochlorothrix hollandica PCC 9006 = CALU 1027]